MKIETLMVPNPLTVTVRAKVDEALELMKCHAIRHLPVVDAKNQLQGLLTLADLKRALLPAMMGDLTLAEMMIKDPYTVSPDDDIEYAAQLIYNHKIGGLPVVKGRQLVGIITESDILRAFIDMMGILSNSSRIDVTTGIKPDELNRAIHIIQRHGGDIINVGMTAKKKAKRTYYFRLTPCNTRPIAKALENEGFVVQAVMT